MPVISKIGAKSFKVRLVYGTMLTFLIIGAATMVYPLLLMLSGSVKSETDIVYVRPYPRYWFDDEILFQKYVESKYNMRHELAEQCWWQKIGSWRAIRPVAREESEYLQDFLSWRSRCKS